MIYTYASGPRNKQAVSPAFVRPTWGCYYRQNLEGGVYLPKEGICPTPLIFALKGHLTGKRVQTWVTPKLFRSHKWLPGAKGNSCHC